MSNYYNRNTWQRRSYEQNPPQNFQHRLRTQQYPLWWQQQNRSYIPPRNDFAPPRNQVDLKNNNNQVQSKNHNNRFRPNTVADYAERDFPPNIAAADRWTKETQRPVFPCNKAMAEKAFAQHFEISPEKSPNSSMHDEHF